MESTVAADAAQDDAVDRELREAQAIYLTLTDIRARRTAAVLAAKARGWRTSQIARVMNVDSASVNAIVSAAQKQEPTS